jgi:hypothetical protein
MEIILQAGQDNNNMKGDRLNSENTQDRSFNLVPKTAPSIWLRTCVGLTVLDGKRQLMQKLHDWAVVSLYLLSYNKFLTYSVLTPLRRTTWTTFGINIFIMVLQEPSTYNPNLFLMDAIHLSCTIVDVLNLSEERLTPSNKE